MFQGGPQGNGVAPSVRSWTLNRMANCSSGIWDRILIIRDRGGRDVWRMRWALLIVLLIAIRNGMWGLGVRLGIVVVGWV